MAKAGIVDIIGVPIDLGANMRGANVGPAAVRIAGLKKKIAVLGYEVRDTGDLAVPIREQLPPEAQAEKYLGAITDICSQLEKRNYDSLASGALPLNLGGDHCLAIGSIGGVSRFFAEKKEQIGVIWIDAHADLNTPSTSPSGNIHGMPLAALLGEGHADLVSIGGKRVRPENVALIGIRTIDASEKDVLKKSGVNYYSMREIDEKGMFKVMTEAIAVATKGTAGIHLSCDLDGIDPLYAPGVSTPVTGGLSYREAHLALEMLADTGKLVSMDFVEVNPFTDKENHTAMLTVELAQSALGKAIV